MAGFASRKWVFSLLIHIGIDNLLIVLNCGFMRTLHQFSKLLSGIISFFRSIIEFNKSSVSVSPWKLLSQRVDNLLKFFIGFSIILRLFLQGLIKTTGIP